MYTVGARLWAAIVSCAHSDYVLFASYGGEKNKGDVNEGVQRLIEPLALCSDYNRVCSRVIANAGNTDLNKPFILHTAYVLLLHHVLSVVVYYVKSWE